MCGELSEVFAQLLGFCCFCSMRTLCKSSLEIATTLHPRRRTFYLTVDAAKSARTGTLAVQLPTWHPLTVLTVPLPDSSATVHLANLLLQSKICSYCEIPVQSDRSDEVNFGQLMVNSALRFSAWPFADCCDSLPRSQRNLMAAALCQTDDITIWCCSGCLDFVPATAVVSSTSSSAETDSALASVSEVSEDEELCLTVTCLH